MKIVEKQLKKGPLLVMLPIRGINTILSSIWVNTGSIKETEKERGLSHIIEHMVFKGTHKRTAEKIVNDIEYKGGYINAFTSREFTVYYTKMPYTEWKIGIDVITDLVVNPLFPENEWNKEKFVIAEELRNSVDSPDERVFDILYESIYKGHSLSNPIGGYLSDVLSYKRKDLLNYYEKHYHNNNMIIIIVGNFSPKDIVSFIDGKFEDRDSKLDIVEIKKPNFNVPEKLFVKKEDISQSYIAMATPAFSVYDKQRYALSVINTHIGYGMTSVLFQELREKKGLAYSIYSFTDNYKIKGVFGIYALTKRESTDVTIDTIFNILKKLRKRPISNKEMRNIKHMIKGNIMISLDNITEKMTGIAKNYFYYGEYIPVEDILHKIDSVKMKTIENIAEEIFNTDKFTVVSLGSKKPKGFKVINESKDKKTLI